MTHRTGRLLLCNLATDVDDPILGFTTDWIRELANHCSAMDVISMRCGRIEVPDHVTVHSLGKEAGYSEPRRLARFEHILARALRRRPDGCLFHMIPVLAVAGAPLLMARRIPTTLWYAHSASGLGLRVAERLVDWVATPSPESFPLESPKVVVTGHGVDTRRFTPPTVPRCSGRRGKRLRLLAVSRLSPVKRIDVLMDAVADVARTHPVRLRIVGPTLRRDEEYVRELRRRIELGGHEELIELAGARTQSEMPSEYADADLVVSFSETGSLDKVTLEALATGVLVASTNRACAEVVRQLATPLALDGPGDLLSAVRWVATMSDDDRRRLAERGRRQVVEEHSLERLAPRLAKLATTVRSV